MALWETENTQPFWYQEQGIEDKGKASCVASGVEFPGGKHMFTKLLVGQVGPRHPPEGTARAMPTSSIPMGSLGNTDWCLHITELL